MLTPIQLKSLHYDLQELAHIEYSEVMDELLDHYATLTEQKMTNGMSFDEASKWAWFDLGSAKGVQTIQENYVKTILSQVKGEHMAILKNYFRWPALMTTALAGLLIYLTVPLIPFKPLLLGTTLIVLSPLPILGWGYMKSVDERVVAGKIIWQYMQHKGMLAINLIQLGLNLPNGLFENGAQTTRTFLQAHPNVSITICLLTLLYTISFVQLFHKKFYYKTA